MVRGYTLFGEALAREGIDTGFYIMGGPINDAVKAAISGGVRMIDTRHEQAAAMSAQAYARVRCKPGICMGASGPGTINLTLGLANALIDCAPVVAFGGASPVSQYMTGAFQEIDQVAIMRPVTKWAERVYDARRIPEYVNLALRRAMAGKPGPVYIDLPGDVLYAEVPEDEVIWPRTPAHAAQTRPAADDASLAQAAAAIVGAKRPVIVTGSGILWSQASDQLQALVDATGIPFYTTPQGRGVVPEDHPYFYGHARSTAFKEADVVLVVGTRLNYVISYAKPPRFADTATVIQIDTDAEAVVGNDRVNIGIVADAAVALEQLVEATRGKITQDTFAPWRGQLTAVEEKRAPKHEEAISTDQVPIHPQRLCKEVRDFIDRDTILVVDGQEILNFGRQTIPSYRPGHRLNSGPFGTMGVGMPFGVGAKAARPDSKVVVLHGDGSFGLNAMELDTAVRHDLPVLVVISLNGGWTADPDKIKPGRDLGYTRFDQMAITLGCYAEFVEKPEDIRPALERGAAAVAKGQTALINVVTDWKAISTTASFTAFRT
jgi:thiamine pyrophosphate-dependent acetolactate synthase large subunit-like protein